MKHHYATRQAALILAATAFLVAAAHAQTSKSPSCQPIGGMLMTNLGAIDANTTMGPATGDLKGSVGATILSTKAFGKKLVFHVQHHWVTDSGDTLSFDPAKATTISVASGLYAVITYPVHVTGGTGKYTGVTGDLNFIGEVELDSGQLVLRYSGQLCSSKSN
jgi:hypothetical protein